MADYEAGYVDEEELEEMPETERELADDAQWKLIQKNTFTRWANEHLKTAGKSLNDLTCDLSDGLRLAALVEVLAATKFKSLNKRPNFRTQKLENVTMTLKFLEYDEGIKLVNIDSTDIVDCKLKLILGLIWTLILHYSISMPMWEGEEEPSGNEKGKGQTAKQRLLGWVNAKMPDKPIKNFTTDWNDGTAIGALVDAIAPGLCPDWEDWNPKNAIKNAREALNAAQQWLDVPQLIKPEEMVNPKLDEKAMMTYLSQFPNAKLKPGAPLRPKTNPARVRAYGPGLEPEGNTVGAPARFTVDTFSAGKANLEIIVLNPKGQKENCEVKFNDDRNLTYSCMYTPVMEGQYRVIIKFAAKEIPKSPFNVNVQGAAGDPKKVTAQGPGVEPNGNQVGKRTFFNIFLNNAGNGNVDVIVLDPQGRRDVIKPRITKQSEDNYLVEYTPREPGVHSVNVFFAGTGIPKSPYGVNVTPKGQDPANSKAGLTPQAGAPQPVGGPKSGPQAKMQPAPQPGAGGNAQLAYATGRGIQPNGIRVTENVEFKIHTENAGQGEVKVKINGPGGVELPYQLKKVSGVLYSVTYTAHKPGRYVIIVTFAGAPIQRAPFNVDIGPMKTTKIRAYGPGLESGIVGQLCPFTVVTNGEIGSLGFSIDGPSEAKISCKDNGDGSADVSYLPTAPGEYAVHILCNDEDIPKSPYCPIIFPAAPDCKIGAVKAFGPGLSPDGVKVKSNADFTVDPRPAGGKPQPLVVTCADATGEPVPVQVTSRPDGTFACRYNPQKPEKHTVCVTYGGASVPGSPFRVNVGGLAAPGNAHAFGPGIETATRGVPTFFSVDCKMAGPGDVGVQLKESNGQITPAKITKNGDGTFRVDYTPKMSGPLTITVTFAGKPVPGSPFKVPVNEAAHPEKVKVYGPGIETASQNVPTFFTVDCKEAGPGPMVVALVDSQGRPVPAKTVNNGDGTHRVEYTAQIQGPLTVTVQFAGHQVPKSPFKVPVTAGGVPGVHPEKVKVYGPGIENAMQNVPTFFTVDCKEAGPNPTHPQVALLDSQNKPVPVKVTNNGDGTHRVDYTPHLLGPLTVNVGVGGQPVPKSPFKVPVSAGGAKPEKVKVYGPGIESATQNVPTFFTVDCKEAGPVSLVPQVAMVDSSNRPIAAKVTNNGDGTHRVDYTPQLQGPLSANVMVAGKPVPRSPFKVPVGVGGNPGEKVKVYGPGIESASPNVPTFFTVDCKDAAPVALQPQVALLDSQNKPVPAKVTNNGDGTHRVDYTPHLEGPLTANVGVGGQPVPKSPFKVPVTHAANPADKVKVSGPGLESATRDIPTHFTVDATEAGPGQLSLALTDSQGQPIQAEFQPVADNVTRVAYTPKAAGPMTAHVTFNNQPVPKSPFQVEVLPELDVSKVFVENLEPNVPVGEEQEFDVITSSLPAKVPCSVAVENPAGVQEPVPAQETVDGFAVPFTLKEPGPHKVHVACGGKPIPKSPFAVTGVTGVGEEAMPRSVAPGQHSAPGQPLTANGEPQPVMEEAIPMQKAPGQHSAPGHPLAANGEPQPVAEEAIPMHKAPGQHSAPDGGAPVPVSEDLVAPAKAAPKRHAPPADFPEFPDFEEPSKWPHAQEGEPGWKVKAYGDGLTKGLTNKPNHFTIDSREAPAAPLGVTVEGPSEAKIECSDNGDGTCGVTYVTDEPGVYTVNVLYQDKHIPGSPFKPQVVPDGRQDLDVSKVVAHGPGLEPTGVYKQSFAKFDVDARAIDTKGDGVVKATVMNIKGQKSGVQVVNNKDGTYKCSYSPMEEGPYKVDVTYDGQKIADSPFPVMVQPGCDPTRVTAYGPGLQGGMPDQPAVFTVDLDGAGQGGLSLSVEGPAEAKINCSDNKDGTCKVEYMPVKAGQYDVHVKFADTDIPGSPFKVPISDKVDPTKCKAYGRGLEPGGARKDRPATFQVDASEAGFAPLKAQVTPQGGQARPAVVEPKRNQPGVFDVTYVPDQLGPATIDVQFAGQPIPGSPFSQDVQPRSQPEKVRVHGDGLKPTGVPASLPARFTIDPRDAGDGDVEVAIATNKGRPVQPKIEPLTDGTYEVEYRPEDVCQLDVHVRFDGEELPQSPYHVSTVPTGRADLCKFDRPPSEHVPVNQECVITVNTRDAGRGAITCHIVTPTGSDSDIEIEDNGDGTVSIFYTPSQVGEHPIEIKFGGQTIPKGNFKQTVGGDVVRPSRAGKAQSIPVQHDAQPGAFHPVDFKLPVGPIFSNVDATVITPSGKEERPQLVDNKDGTVTFKYQPSERGTHQLVVTYNGRPVPGSPFKFMVDGIGTGRVSAYGPGLSHGRTGEPAEFTIVTKDAGPGGLALAVEGPSKAEIQCVDNKDGTCSVSYLPLAPGDYSISIRFQDKHIQGSPFVAKISGEPRKRAQVSMGSASEVPLKISETDISNLTASIKSPTGREEPCVLKRLPTGHLGISFTPKETGDHQVNVFRAGAHIPNSPFTISVAPSDVANPSLVKVFGPGLEHGMANENNQFTVDTREAGFGSLSLSIEGPSKSDIECHDNHDGTCLVTYRPTEPGSYVLNVKYADEHVPGSPFRVDIGGEPAAPITERITHTREATDVSHVGSQCELSLRIPGTNPKDMSASVTSPSGVTERCDVIPTEENNYVIKFVPKEMGQHSVAVRHRDVHIPGSPFQFTVGPITEGGAHKVHATGPGLEQGFVGLPNEFTIYTREAGAGGLSIAIEGPSKAEIDFEDRKDGSCGVNYHVQEPGEYLCSIKFNDDHIPDSPFRIPVLPAEGAIKQTALAALQQAPSGPQVGRPAAITVNSEPGQGPLQAIVVSPSGAEQAGIVQAIQENQYAVRFIPKENGPHLIHVSQDGKEVPGSPFRVIVGLHDADPGMVHASGEGLVRGKVGQKNKFFVNTVQAGSGALSVTIDGPSKVQLNCHEHDDGYEFHYVATEPGEYLITIKYGGNFHIAGSPFHAQITSDGQEVQESQIAAQSHFVVETVEKAAPKFHGLLAMPGESHPERVVCQGMGLKRAAVNEQNHFIVDASQAGNECLFVGIMGPIRPCEEVNIRHIGDNRFAVSYEVRETGRYVIMVKFGDHHVPGSPFNITVP